MKKRNTTILVAITILSLASVIFIPRFVFAADCGGAETSIINCNGEGEVALMDVIKQVVKIMAVGVGVLAVGAVITGGILYSMAGSNPEYMKKAKTIWINTIIGLAIFAFFAAITNFIIPGGIIG
ncbi:hypothetical protein EOM33_05920 [Candidatus Saccharibacteria bacterium]|nr:hypothetical protein [Candidatus Saccharibacteria bacterium]